jgi:hypothetical protein
MQSGVQASHGVDTHVILLQVQLSHQHGTFKQGVNAEGAKAVVQLPLLLCYICIIQRRPTPLLFVKDCDHSTSTGTHLHLLPSLQQATAVHHVGHCT